MKDESIDRLFEDLPAVPREFAASVRQGIITGAHPVKPLFGTMAQACVFSAAATVVAIAFAMVFGFDGLKATSPLLLTGFGLLPLIFGGWITTILTRAMRPGSGRLPIWIAGLSACVCYQLLAYLTLSNFSLKKFVPEGLICFGLGTFCAITTAAALWLLIRRGMIVDTVRAGAALGTLGGLTGLFALTLHCPNQTVPHLVVWHAAVPLLGLLAGALLGKLWANARTTDT